MPHAIERWAGSGERGHDFLPSRRPKKAIFTKTIHLSRNGFILFENIQNLKKLDKCYVESIEHKLKKGGELNKDQWIYLLGVFNESCFDDTIGDLYLLANLDFEEENRIVSVDWKEFYDEVKEFLNEYKMKAKVK